MGWGCFGDCWSYSLPAAVPALYQSGHGLSVMQDISFVISLLLAATHGGQVICSNFVFQDRLNVVVGFSKLFYLGSSSGIQYSFIDGMSEWISPIIWRSWL